MSNINPRRKLQVTREKGTRTIEAKIELARLTVVLVSARVRHVEVHVPSARLSMMGEAFFEADSGDLEIGNGSYGPSTWKVQARAKGTNQVSDVLHFVDPVGAADEFPASTAERLPRSYETDSAVKILRFRMEVNCPVNAIAVAIPGVWYFRAMWEPNTDVDDLELQEMFSRCHAELVLSLDP